MEYPIGAAAFAPLDDLIRASSAEHPMAVSQSGGRSHDREQTVRDIVMYPTSEQIWESSFPKRSVVQSISQASWWARAKPSILPPPSASYAGQIEEPKTYFDPYDESPLSCQVRMLMAGPATARPHEAIQGATGSSSVQNAGDLVNIVAPDTDWEGVQFV